MKLIATISGTSYKDELDITILETPDEKENDVVRVSGGVGLDDKGVITFPIEMSSVDGVGSETSYEAKEYSAVLKNPLTKDFSISFDVANYVVSSDSPKLQIALGEGSADNFYITYYTQGNLAGTYRFEFFGKGLYQDGMYRDGWYQSSSLGENFDPSATHSFRIVVDNDGKYHVYCDNNELSFLDQQIPVSLYRTYEKLSTNQATKFATKNMSCSISNLVVTNGDTIKETPWWSYNSNSTITSDSEFSLKLCNGGWLNRDNYYNRIIRTTNVEGDFTIEYDVTFDDATSDSKLVLRMGNNEFHVCNKVSGNEAGMFAECNNNGTYTGAVNVSNENLQDLLKAHVVITRKGDEARFIVNDVEVKTISGVSANQVEFYAFNSEIDHQNDYVEVSNFEVKPYEEVTLYDFNVEGGTNRSLEIGKEETLTLNTLINGSASETRTIEGVISDQEVISFDKDTFKVTALKEGEATLTLTWVEANKSIVINYEVTAIPTENDVLSVKGGAVLNSDGSVTFPKELINQNGIVNEDSYVESDYSVNLKQKVKGDFDIEFTVSDYEVAEGQNYPKLMVSLGGSGSNFYVVYNRNEGGNLINQIESKTYGQDNNLNCDFGSSYWHNSKFSDDFDNTIAHTYKISVRQGHYEVYLDGELLSFTMDNTPKNLVRRFEDFTSETPIRFATNGVSATVSNIKVTDVEDDYTYYYLNDSNFTNVTDNGFTIKADNDGWDNGDRYINKIRYNDGLIADGTIEFNASYSATMTDGKFMITVGSERVMINNKNGVLSVNGNNFAETPLPDATYTSFKVKIERIGTELKIYINDTLSLTLVSTGSELSFNIFNTNENDKDVTVTVSNLVITRK